MGNVKNIIVGAARVFVSNGNGSSRPDMTSATVFPVNMSGSVVTNATSASGTSTPQFLGTTASAYWRDMGYTNNGVEISYEPGYGDVMVDQLLDAARLFKQTLKIMIKTEITEATLENLNIVLGQSDTVTTYSPGAIGGTEASTNTLDPYGTNSGTASVSVLRLAAGALGDAPVERTLVLVGNAPGQFGKVYGNPSSSGISTVVSPVNNSSASAIDVSGVKKKERIYVARRVVQMSTTSHALKRDAATVFPVEFRCLPDDDDKFDGAEYGFLVDRVYGS